MSEIDDELEEALEAAACELSSTLPEGSAALIISEHGQVGIMIPKPEGDEAGVPMPTLVVTELMMRLTDGDLTIESLCEAMVARVEKKKH